MNFEIPIDKRFGFAIISMKNAVIYRVYHMKNEETTEMKRLLLDEMKRWKAAADRKPLIVKGVRQCGKTYLLKEF
ncbi:MAG: hypothetical protein LBE16_06705, partial [Clostridiales Family XIII bacterium]|nr:hypothetical protein [Clostridiales Family XIII bacterium]